MKGATGRSPAAVLTAAISAGLKATTRFETRRASSGFRGRPLLPTEPVMTNALNHLFQPNHWPRSSQGGRDPAAA
jgi:hypothetical protein